jgi:hypothetical protein
LTIQTSWTHKILPTVDVNLRDLKDLDSLQGLALREVVEETIEVHLTEETLGNREARDTEAITVTGRLLGNHLVMLQEATEDLVTMVLPQAVMDLEEMVEMGIKTILM